MVHGAWGMEWMAVSKEQWLIFEMTKIMDVNNLAV